jgi:sulfite reductase (NADPH) flavoprotein alpha-component
MTTLHDVTITTAVVQMPPVPQVSVLPETAPFTADQRAWLNGFFAGMLSVEAALAVPGAAVGTPPATTPAQDDASSHDASPDDAPWHDPAMAIGDRLALAEDKPHRRRLYAAMAQQNCGQCGYLCESYADALATGAEAKPNLCVPGGKDTTRAVKKLLDEIAALGSAPAVSDATVATPAQTAGAAAVPGYSRAAPVDVTFVSATPLNGEGSEKDTRHVVFDLTASGIVHAPGDSFGLVPTNDPGLVDAVLCAIGADPDFPVHDGERDTVKTLRRVLIEDYALGPQAPDALFQFISYIVGGDRRRKAKALAAGADPDGDAATYDVLQAVTTLGPMRPDPEAFLECLEPLQPRLYSISSSPLATPGELHLTVDTVRYDLGGRLRRGVASTHLAERAHARCIMKAYVQKAHGFGLPADPTTPIVMIGPGTGIAPFRSFLWHREAQRRAGTRIGEAWLFFGHQRERCDFYYREELEALLASGTLTYLSTAWSRDGDRKVYVQDRMREAGAALWSWLDRGAHVYVCGDAKRMAKDVETALADIVATHGARDGDAARRHVRDLKAAGRYQTDVY